MATSVRYMQGAGVRVTVISLEVYMRGRCGWSDVIDTGYGVRVAISFVIELCRSLW